MDAAPLEQRPFWDAIWPVLACGAGLFSDGYVNNVCVPFSIPLKEKGQKKRSVGLTLMTGYWFRRDRVEVRVRGCLFELGRSQVCRGYRLCGNGRCLHF